MACKYTINGEEDEMINDFFQTIEDNKTETTPEDLYNVLIENGVLNNDPIAIAEGVDLYPPQVDIEDLKQVIDDLNAVYAEYFSNVTLPGVPVAGLRVINTPDFTGATIEINSLVGDSVLIDRNTNSGVTGLKESKKKVNNDTTKINLALNKLKINRGWTVDEATNKYVRVVDGVKEFATRVTDFIKEKGAGGKLFGPAQKAADRGTIIDGMLRMSIDMFNNEGRYPTVEEYFEFYNQHELKSKTSDFSNGFIKSLHQIFTKDILPKFNNEFTLIADIPTLSGYVKGTLVAGTVDIIGYTPDGEFIIIDLKTSNMDRRQVYEGIDKYETQFTDAKQLTVYQELFRQITGITPGLAILPVKMDYNEVTDSYASAIVSKGKNGEILLQNKLLDAAKRKLKISQSSKAKKLSEREIKKNKLFAIKEGAEKTYEDVKLALQSQLEYLSRQSKVDSEKTQKIQDIIYKLKKVEEGNDIIEDYLGFIDYLVDLANDSSKILSNVQDNYYDNMESMSKQEKFELMNQIIQIKLNLDSFYNNAADKTIISKLEDRIKDLEGEKSDILDTLQEIGSTFRELDEAYLNTGIPILANVLVSYAPLKVNEDLDNMIKLIEESIAAGKPRFIGLDRDDSRIPAILSFEGIRNKFSKSKQIEISRINIQQLESRKIGVDQIIHSLKESHKDPSIFSAWADPIVYANETTLQLIAQMLKSEYVGATEKTRKLLFELNPAFEEYRTYMNSLGVSEDNTAKFHAPLFETVTQLVQDMDGNFTPQEVASFVSEVDRNKWYSTKKKAITDLREKYNFPEKGTGSEKNAYFKSEVGRAYMQAVSQWWKDNSEPKDGAQEFLKNLDEEILELRKDLQKAYKAGDSLKISEVYDQINGLTRTRNSIYRNGVFIGKMARPKMNLYENEKFKNMPPQVKAYYNVLLETYKASQKITGKTGMFKDSWMDYSLQLPSIESQAVDHAIENGFVDAVKKVANRATTAQVTDTEFVRLTDANNEKFKTIPLYFVNRVEASLVSKNITNSIVMFADMAHRFQANSNLYGAVNLAHLAVQKRKLKEIAPTMGTTLNYYGNLLAKQLRLKRDNYIEGGNAADMIGSFLDDVYYGETHERAKRKVLNSIATRKGVSLLTSFTSLTQLGLNGLQASNQFLMDWTVGSQEAWAGEYFGMEEMLWAGGIMSMDGKAIFRKVRYTAEQIAGNKFTPSTKLSKFMDWSETDRSFGVSRSAGSGSIGKKVLDRGLGNLHVLQEIPDLYLSAKKVLALQRSYKGKLLDKNGNVVMNDNNEPADLYDLLTESKNGNLVLDPRVANFDKGAYVSRVQAMLTKTTQLKGAFNRTRIERKTAGPLVTLFRTWMVPNYRKRLGYGGGLRIDVESGELQEGYYSTTYNILQEVLANKGNISLLMQNTRSESEKRNLKRMLHEIIAIHISGAAATFFGMLLAGLDDDDDEQYWAAFATYQAMRLNTEYKAFSSYKEAVRIISSPTATTRSLENVFNLVDIILEYGIDNTEDNEVLYYQRKTGQYEKGDAKINKYLKNITFGLGGLTKTQNPEDAIKYYDMFWGGDEYKLGEVLYESGYDETPD